MRFAIFFLAVSAAGQTRIASDFEIQQMERQVAQSHEFVSQLSGHLNLGDLRLTRNESALAHSEYVKALEIASNERLAARRASDLTRYATATSYAALAQAKLGDAPEAFALSEEAMRYSSDSAKSWNLYSSTMSQLQMQAKAASAARNAVALEHDPLDLAIYKYSLASALGDTAQAEQLLLEVVKSLRSNTFADLRRQVARTESFEIYSTARGDVAAYISILNRSQLRLARLYEDRGELAPAREQYTNVLADRSDDPTALAAMARLEPSEDHYKQAFDANPFSLPLIRDYQRFLSKRRAASGEQEIQTTGDQVRLGLQQMQRGEFAAAIATVGAMEQHFPNNDTLALLRHEIEEKRSAFLAAYENRAQLDKQTFTGTVVFDQGPPFETGKVDGVPFRFSEPMNFSGNFAAHAPLRLTYRILGPTQLNGTDALLLEPLRLEAAR